MSTNMRRASRSSNVLWRASLAASGCLCLLVGLGASVALGQIFLSGDFDHGSLDEANSSVAGNLITLAGRDNYNPGDWKWLNFSVGNVAGLQPTFQIGDNFATGGSNLSSHAMVYSYDQQTWEFFDNNARSASQNTFTFSNNSAFTQNQVYVAYGLPYSYGRVAAHTSQLATNPWVAPTLSGNSSLVVGQSPGGLDDLGRVVTSRDIFGYRITDATVTGAKKKIAVISGVHANETLGNYTLEGLVDFLVGDSVEAALLRGYAEFYIYPMANPDGRFAGYNRSTVQRESLDPNRHWESPHYGTLSDIREVGNALLADTAGDVDYFVDLHSTVSGKSGHYGLVHPDIQADPFWQTLLQLEPGVSTQNAGLTDLTGQKFGHDELHAEFTMTFETQFIAGENSDRFHDLGRNMGLAFGQILRSFADLNFDGQLDEQDWLLLLAGAETDLRGLSPLAAYAAGDLDGDGVNSIVDFGLFKDAYVAVHGLSGFAALFVTVPEPDTALLATLALGGCCRRKWLRINHPDLAFEERS